MRDKWYSDNRDLIKWSVLLLLARRYEANRIIQVAFHNPSDFGLIEIDGKTHPIPSEVLAHFRDLRNVTGISYHPKISVFDCPFQDRDSYLQAALSYVASFNQERCVVFLDPDTGLEPNGGGDAKHVLEKEAHAFWDAIPEGDTFVLYQHETNKAGKSWKDEKRAQLASAIEIPDKEIGVASGLKIAKDVVFFYAHKNRRWQTGS